MREHGVPAADPQILPDGTVRVGGGYDKQAVDPDVFDNAMQACKQYEPILSGPDREGKLESARQYSQCMRAHGVEDFPDPDPDGRLRLPDDPTDPDYDQATATCRAQPLSSPGMTRS